MNENSPHPKSSIPNPFRVAILDDYQGVAARFWPQGAIPGVETVAFSDHVATSEDLVRRLRGFHAVMRIRERTAFPADVINALPDLKVILATGMRNARSIDLAAADARGIVVCATDALHQTTVEVTWALIFSLTRRMPQETASLRAGGWQIGLGRNLAGLTLGIVGLGNMGIPVSRIGQILGMKVVAWSPNLTPERTAPHGVECVSKSDLFRMSDVITIHMPLTDATLGLVGDAELAAMKRDAVIINTARPQIVNEEALVRALLERRIGGAGLDVFEVEPLPKDHPFRTLTNVVATPHIGFVTEANYEIFYGQTIENLRAWLAGAPINQITAARPFLPDSQVARQMFAAGHV
ncbi:D-2-hydroxyacid dehydrogenase family protein [Xanthobacter flavus]|uniref:D-2-hydroxyacid dehydrogenase family protein n=1 Tax=Xanthobacter flavus TaxID=281 RepID=UPI003728C757